MIFKRNALIPSLMCAFLESEVDLGIRDQLLRLALGKKKKKTTNQAFTPETTQYQHCLQSIFHKGAPRSKELGVVDKWKERKETLFNFVTESADERQF